LGPRAKSKKINQKEKKREKKSSNDGWMSKHLENNSDLIKEA
jgi:hypothetical protein